MCKVIGRLLLLFINLFFAFPVNAQTCAGTFGDPIIYQDFGSGTGPGRTLPDSATGGLVYTRDSSPKDGYYFITNGIFGSRNAFPKTWNNVFADHTGNPGGYMMAVNIPKQSGNFYKQTLINLRKGNVYELSFYVLNLVKRSINDRGVIDPRIRYTIFSADNKVLAVDSTGAISRTDGAYWYRFSLEFKVPENTTEVVLNMSDTAPGGDGNDFIIDDITLRVCRESKIIVPNTFTPNYDGINDLWVIDQLPNYPKSVIKVFNRYGQQVFQSTGYSRPWDGRFNGYQVPKGVYYYLIDLHNNTPQISGWVMVLR